MDGQGHTGTKARWYVFDGLGSVVGEVDPLGNLTSSPKYDVYGAVRSNGGTASSKQGFVGSLGHVSDDTGLIYMRARYYDSNLGRFASEDPGMHGANWFAYCNNNPVRFVDESGQDAQEYINNALQLFAGYLITMLGPQLIKSGIANMGEGAAMQYEGAAKEMEGFYHDSSMLGLISDSAAEANGKLIEAMGARTSLMGLGKFLTGCLAIMAGNMILGGGMEYAEDSIKMYQQFS